MLRVICTRLCHGHLSEGVDDRSRRSEEIVKRNISRIAPFSAVIIFVISGMKLSECKLVDR